MSDPTASKPNLFKTEMCRNWTEMGQCRYGRKCRFAHGHDELRTVQRHARYKTEICKTYHLTGTCLYGVRCTFIHDERLCENKSGILSEPASLNVQDELAVLDTQDALSTNSSSAASSPLINDHRANCSKEQAEQQFITFGVHELTTPPGSFYTWPQSIAFQNFTTKERLGTVDSIWSFQSSQSWPW